MLLRFMFRPFPDLAICRLSSLKIQTKNRARPPCRSPDLVAPVGRLLKAATEPLELVLDKKRYHIVQLPFFLLGVGKAGYALALHERFTVVQVRRGEFLKPETSLAAPVAQSIVRRQHHQD